MKYNPNNYLQSARTTRYISPFQQFCPRIHVHCLSMSLHQSARSPKSAGFQVGSTFCGMREPDIDHK